MSATGLIALTFAAPLVQDRAWLQFGDANEPERLFAYARLFVFYVCTYFIVVFFNASLICSVHLRLTGENPTLMDGMRAAWARKGEIFRWVLLAATVGMILNTLKKQSQGI